MRYLLFIVLLFYSSLAYSIESIRGVADVTLIKKTHTYHFTQAVVIDGLDDADFEALDDFGNTLFRVDFSKNGKTILETGLRDYTLGNRRFKKLLSLPISKEEFIGVLLDYPNCEENKKIKIVSTNRKNIFSYPNEIRIISKKATLAIVWRKIILIK